MPKSLDNRKNPLAVMPGLTDSGFWRIEIMAKSLSKIIMENRTEIVEAIKLQEPSLKNVGFSEDIIRLWVLQIDALQCRLQAWQAEVDGPKTVELVPGDANRTVNVNYSVDEPLTSRRIKLVQELYARHYPDGECRPSVNVVRGGFYFHGEEDSWTWLETQRFLEAETSN